MNTYTEKKRQYYLDNREKIREKGKKWYIANREKERERKRKYYAENREKFKKYHIAHKKRYSNSEQLTKAIDNLNYTKKAFKQLDKAYIKEKALLKNSMPLPKEAQDYQAIADKLKQITRYIKNFENRISRMQTLIEYREEKISRLKANL